MRAESRTLRLIPVSSRDTKTTGQPIGAGDSGEDAERHAESALLASSETAADNARLANERKLSH
jgi:hypothetical protein